MTDPASFAVSFGAAKSGFDLLKTFVDVRDATKVMQVKYELMSLLVQAQEAEAVLIADKRQLEEHLRELEAWDGETTRYELSDIGAGCVAYTLKADAQPPEPFHMLCAQCYQNRQKRYLQRSPRAEGGQYLYHCSACKSSIPSNYMRVKELGAPDG